MARSGGGHMPALGTSAAVREMAQPGGWQRDTMSTNSASPLAYIGRTIQFRTFRSQILGNSVVSECLHDLALHVFAPVAVMQATLPLDSLDVPLPL